MAKVHDAYASEDLVQETLIAAIEGQKTFPNESTVSTWLFSILRRKIVDHYRATCRQEKTLATQQEMAQRADVASSRHDWHDDPAKICEDLESQRVMDACTEKLPDRLAEVFLMREINQQTPKEIGEVLKISPTNLSMRLHRSRLAIRDCLNANWLGEPS